MRLTLKREQFTDKSTIGMLFVDGHFECYTLEDVVRATKIPGQTAIPYGVYRVVINHSPRFNQDMPLLVDVPDFKGVRIHPGNRAEDTEGCILVGQGYSRDCLTAGTSRPAYAALFRKLRAAQDRSELIELTVGK